MREIKYTQLQQSIIRLLFVRAGSSLNINRISKLLGVSQPAVIKAIPLLIKEEIISAKQDSESKRWSIELNRERKDIIGLKRADNLKQIYECGLVDEIYKKLPGATIIMFGSYSLGEDTINSDIDLAIIGNSKGEIDKKFDKLLEREIIPNYYSSFKSIEKNLLNNILNGIVLKGAIEL
jgi:predicted nucleotidyltransferase